MPFYGQYRRLDLLLLVAAMAEDAELRAQEKASMSQPSESGRNLRWGNLFPEPYNRPREIEMALGAQLLLDVKVGLLVATLRADRS